MKKIMILVAVFAAVAAAVGAVGLAYAQTASPSTPAAATPAPGTPGTRPADSPERFVAGYMDAEQAKLLGMTTAEYQAQEDAGKTWLEIATAQGKTAAEAQTLLETAYSNAIAAALADGKITQAQADALKALPASDPEMGRRGWGDPNGFGVLQSYLKEAFAKALGMTIADFDTQEAAGKSWLEIATSQGKTAAEAQTLLTTAYSQSIDQALADGKITQAQADSLKAAPVPDIANAGMRGRGPGGMHGDADGSFVVHTYLEEAFARALGMTIADFDTQEAADKSWSEIAVAQGKTAAAAQTLLESAYSQSIDQALADGKITQAQADSLKAAAAPTLANVGVPGHGQPGPGGRGGRGPGGPGGKGVGTAPTGTTTTPTTNP